LSGSKSENKASKAQERKRVYNRIVRGRTRTAVRVAREAIASGDANAASQTSAEAISSLDKAVTKGVFHKNKAARLKSRLTRQANKLSSAKSAS
jgi:small subunit ribosomal protein S20